MVIELGQGTLLPQRVASLGDVIANTLGGMLGTLLDAIVSSRRGLGRQSSGSGEPAPRGRSAKTLASGWQKAAGKPLFTRDIAARLFDDGGTVVKLRWHREDHQVPVPAHNMSSDQQ